MLIPTDFLLSYSTLPFLAEVERQIERETTAGKTEKGGDRENAERETKT